MIYKAYALIYVRKYGIINSTINKNLTRKTISNNNKSSAGIFAQANTNLHAKNREGSAEYVDFYFFSSLYLLFTKAL